MHPNPSFRNTSDVNSWKLVSQTSFGTLVQSTGGFPKISHVPFLLSTCRSFIELHLVRSNPMARVDVSEAIPTTLIVNGPDGYISPDWYGIDDQVPTWNYVAVHLTGQLVRLDEDTLEPLLVRLSDHFETQLLPKSIWTMEKMSDDIKLKMKRHILPFKFKISELHSTWKLGQNKPEQVRLDAANALADHVPALAKLMKNLPE
jgi:transcriptional regulator